MFRLALELGRTVEELSETLSYVELLDWMDYYTVEPFGERRADLRNAILCSLIANQNRDKRKRPEPYSWRMFMLFEEQEEVVKDEEQEQRIASNSGATISGDLLSTLFVVSAQSRRPKEK